METSLKIALVRQRVTTRGGAERYIETLAQALMQRGYEVHFLSSRVKTSAPLASHTALRRVPTLNGASWLRALSFAFNARKAIAGGGYNLVMSFERTLKQDIYRAGDGCHREWLAQRLRHAPWWKRFTLWLNPLHAALLWLERRTFSPKNTSVVIANSNRGREDIVRLYRFPAEKIFVIRNGVDSEKFKPMPKDNRGENFTLLLVGSGFERKGLAYAIEALARLPSHVKLRVVGKGKPASYEKLARERGVSGRVEFAGAVSDMQAVYASGDLLLLPTLYDPFANVCLEAMASGLPVVTSRENGASEIIEEGKNGAVVENPADIESLVRAVEPFLNRETLVQSSVHARATAESLPFSENVNKTLQLMEWLLSTRANA